MCWNNMLTFSGVVVCVSKTQVIHTTEVLELILKHTHTHQQITTSTSAEPTTMAPLYSHILLQEINPILFLIHFT